MPEKARVFVAEDRKDWLQRIKRLVESSGHSVVLQASTLSQALRSVGKFEELGVQVAIIDGNLTEGDRSGSDGAVLVKAINSLTPQVKTIGMSDSPVAGANVNVGKLNAERLGRTITKL